MTMRFPDDDQPLDPTLLEPLLSVQRALEHSPLLSDRFFEPLDFMYMGELVRPRNRPNLHLFKHIYTRRYLNLEADGYAHRYLPPKREAHPSYRGQYRPHRSLRDPVDHLELWELPWMKPGLEAFTLGLPWDDRWDLRDINTGDLLTERRRR